MDPLLDSLNEQQRAAVCHGDGPLLILAGAGSGKTRVLTHRLAYLVQRRNVSPWNILAVTFTNKAANEMRQRAQSLVSQLPRDAWVGTFHSLCARILRRHGALIGIDPSFSISDDADQLALIKQCLKQLNLDDKQYPPRSVLSAIGRAKDELVDPRTFAEVAVGPQQEVTAQVYRLYQDKLALAHSLDFDDLIMRTVELLRESPEALQHYRQQFTHILIDEYQDINAAQYTLVRVLAEPERNVFAVGDDDQSIYAFRGANVSIILGFSTYYPEARVVKLEQNYRSTKTILDASWHVVKENRNRHDKRLWTQRGPGDPIYVYEAMDERDEAAYVASRVAAGRANGMRLSDFAVLYRVNAQSRAIEEEFGRRGLPYRVVAGLRFYDRREVKDIIAYLRVISNPSDSVSLQRIINVPARGIGETTMARLAEYASSHGVSLYQALAEADAIEAVSRKIRHALAQFHATIEELRREAASITVSQLLLHTLEKSGYVSALRAEGTGEAETRLQNLQEMLTVTQGFEADSPDRSLSAFLEHISLMSDVDTYDPDANDAVTLMTLHAAKGLEFPEVFLVGMDDGLLPFSRSLDQEDQLEEERRLCYVGMTRAMHRLHLIRAHTRTLFGSQFICQESRFLASLPRGILRLRGTGASGQRTAEQEPASAQAAQLRSPSLPPGIRDGSRVRHPSFGEGRIVATTSSGADTFVTVIFDDAAVGMKRLSLQYAKLDPA